mgnify:FL=1
MPNGYEGKVKLTVVGGLPTAVVTRQGLANLMVKDCLRARECGSNWQPKLVFSSNGQGVALAGSDTRFFAAMIAADLIHADGMSVVHASRLTSNPLPERVATTDFFHDAAEAAGEAGLRFFLLGSTREQNAAAEKEIRRLYPRVNIVGSYNGYFDESEDEEVCREIVSRGTDILWVALGKPRQEYWCVRNRARLMGVGWIKTCGGLYAFLSRDAPRAPRWMQAFGLEWLFRAFNDPKRLLWRYVTTNPYALYRLVRYTKDVPPKSHARGQ